MNENLAPVALFVFNRPIHTKRTIEALLKNDLANETQFYVFADGARNTSDDADVLAVRDIVLKFKQKRPNINFIQSDLNIGCANSIMSGITQVLKEFNRVIVIEDDIVTSRGFLNFMNTSYAHFGSDENFWGTSGFSFPFMKSFDKAFFMPFPSAWGWMTTRKIWESLNWDVQYLLGEIKDNKLIDEFNIGGYKYFGMLEAQANGKIDAWDIRFYANLFLRNGLFLYPNKSLVKNIGFDNSGTHGSPSLSMQKINLVDSIHLEKMPVEINHEFVQQSKKGFSEFSKLPLITKLKKRIRSIVKRSS